MNNINQIDNINGMISLFIEVINLVNRKMTYILEKYSHHF